MSLIQQRLSRLSKIDHGVEHYILERVASEDLQAWGNRPETPQRMTLSVFTPTDKLSLKGALTP